MDRVQITSGPKKSQSTEHNNANKNITRKGSNAQSEISHLTELKDIGKKALKKLIPTQIKKLVQKGAGTFKRQIMPNQKLLPSLTLKNMQAEIFEKIIPQNNSFQEMNKKLTHSMLYFQQNICGDSQQGQILRLQSEKCYRKIPRYFFENEISQKDLNRLLTKQKRQCRDTCDQLSDYFDEVQFNVNQQVAYKMKVYMNFVTFLTSVGNLADLSIMKIKGTRMKNGLVRQIVVQRSQGINNLRRRKQEIEKKLNILSALKKLKRLENHLLSQVQTKGKITQLQTYQQYTQTHNTFKKYCCSTNLCKYWELQYYIGHGYHDYFCKQFKKYLHEIIILDEVKIRNILQPKKQQYMTFNAIKTLDDVNMIDESYEVDEGDVELVTKHNIERQIISAFKHGLHKCTYPTNEICAVFQQTIQYDQRKLKYLKDVDLQ